MTYAFSTENMDADQRSRYDAILEDREPMLAAPGFGAPKVRSEGTQQLMAVMSRFSGSGGKGRPAQP